MYFQYKGERLEIQHVGSYGDGSPAYQVVDSIGAPFATLSVFMEGGKDLIGSQEFLAKGWSENANLYDHLVREGFLKETGKFIRSGHVVAMVVKLSTSSL